MPVCFALLASVQPSQSSAPPKSESPAALLVEAREAAASIEDRAERSAAIHPIVLAQIGIDPAGAQETLKVFPKLPNKLNHFTALAAVYAAKAAIPETERIYADIVVEDQSSREGKLAAANALGQLAIAYANKGNLEEAFRTLERLKERTKQEAYAIVGNVTARLAEAQAKQGDVAGAVKTAVNILRDNPYPLMKIVGDRVRKGKTQEAQDIVASLDEASQRYAQWGIVQAQIEQGRLIEAQVTASAIKPGHAKAGALLELAIYHREHKGQPLALTLLQEAESSARAVSDEWTRADMLSRIAAEAAAAGDADRAITIAKSIEKQGRRRTALYDIAAAQTKRGEFPTAFNTAALLKQTPPTNQHPSDYDTAISEILVGMVKAGKGADARETAGRFQDSTLTRSWLYGSIAVAYAELGDITAAKSALAVAETDNQRRARKKEGKELEDKLQLGPGDQTRLDELHQMDLNIRRGLEAIAKAFATKGDLRTAMAVANELNKPAKLDLIKEVFALQVKSGSKEQTLRWARNLSTPSEKVFALVGIATGLSQEAPKGKPEPAPTRKTGVRQLG